MLHQVSKVRLTEIVSLFHPLIFHYLAAIPMLTQSDPGSENYGVANAHTAMRQHLDPSLENTRQHKWMRKHQNIKPEIFWSGFRRNFTEGFETRLTDGDLDHRGFYNPDDPLEACVCSLQ